MARILHADDESEWRVLVQRVLGGQHSVDSVGSVPEAERGLVQHHYDLALVDIDMGDGRRSGEDLLKVLLTAHPATRRLVVTGKPLSGSTRVYIERFELEDVIFKSEHLPEDLRSAVTFALARPAGELPPEIVVHRTDLSYRLRIETRLIGAGLRTRLIELQQQHRQAEPVHRDLAAQVEALLAAVRATQARLSDERSRLQSLIETIRTVEQARRVAEEVERVLVTFEAS